MLYTFKQKSGSTGVVAWGRINGDPKFGTSATGKHWCNFFLRYDSEPKKTPTDKAAGKTIQVSSWEGLAEFCSQLEKGDVVVVFGSLRKNEYKGEETYQISSEVVLSPSCQQMAINAARGMERSNSQNAAEKKIGRPAANNSIPDTGEVFDGLDEDDINDIFPSL